ncbi:MAG: hypothetical protein M3245_02780, partial [Actinomycetota bacterium]|nr:hypothetical protein [Actinomycetota bacterium]
GLVAAFFPSMIVWSTLNLKESWAICAVALLVLGISRMGTDRGSLIVPVVAGMLMMAWVRPWIVFVTAAGAAVGSLFSVRQGRLRAVLLVVLIVGTVSTLFLAGFGRGQVERLQEHGIERVQRSTQHGGSALEDRIDLSNPVAAIKTAPTVLARVLFGPFPWEASGFRQLLTIPEVVFWYAMIPLVLVGIARARRIAPERSRPLLGIAGAVILAIALLEHNLGLLYRHRLQAFIIMFAFAGLALARTNPGRPRFPASEVAPGSRWETADAGAPM